MIKKSLIFSLGIFLILMVFASTVKHTTRNLEKKINKTNKKIFTLKKELNDAQTDFIYLSSPAQLEKYLNILGKSNYSTYHYSKIFFSTNEFLIYNSKETKLLKNN